MDQGYLLSINTNSIDFMDERIQVKVSYSDLECLHKRWFKSLKSSKIQIILLRSKKECISQKHDHISGTKVNQHGYISPIRRTILPQNYNLVFSTTKTLIPLTKIQLNIKVYFFSIMMTTCIEMKMKKQNQPTKISFLCKCIPLVH